MARHLIMPCLTVALLLGIATVASAQVVANQPSSVASPLAEWSAFLATPVERIDEPLAWMHWDAMRLNRIAQQLNDREYETPALRQDYAFRKAQIDARRLALTLTSGSDETLRATVDRMLVLNPDFDIAALAERTRLYLDESGEIETRWAAETGVVRRARESDYWYCFLRHPLVLPIGKRLTTRAASESDLDKLRELERGLEEYHADHPWTTSARGQRQALEQIGKPFSVSLPSLTGGLVHLPAVEKQTVLLLVGPRQTPSLECLDRVAQAVATADGSNASIVIAALSEDAEVARVALAEYTFTSAVAILKRGWRTPLLKQYDIRRLPAALLIDRDGALQEIVRSSDWTDEVGTAVSDFLQSR